MPLAVWEIFRSESGLKATGNTATTRFCAFAGFGEFGLKGSDAEWSVRTRTPSAI